MQDLMYVVNPIAEQIFDHLQQGWIKQCCSVGAGAARNQNFRPEPELVFASFGSGSQLRVKINWHILS
jgi:hypothetical protein